MTDLLFPAFEPRLRSQRKPLYAALLTDIARAASDAFDALSSFCGLLHGSPPETGSPGLMAFDAHVGDTGCHLRAGMFLEAYTLHRNMAVSPRTGEPLTPTWIEENLRRLERTRQNAQNICAALTRDSVRPQTVGLSGKDLPVPKALRAVGWEECIVAGNSSMLYESRSHYPFPEESVDKESDGGSSKDSDTGSHDDWSTSSTDETSSPLRTRWDLHDSRVLVRLIVYSYVLSKYKVFSCTNKEVMARLHPEAAAEMGHTLMSGFWNFEHNDYRPARVERMSQEFRALQTWVSDLSCAWLHTVAERHCDRIPRLLLDTTQKSSTGLATMPCFLSYLMLRQELAQSGHPLLMIDRHFCPHGVHFNMFSAHISATNAPFPPADLDLTRPLKWHIEPVTLDDLQTIPRRSHPHLIVMGNSICGSTLDYKTRLSSCHNTAMHRDEHKKCEHNLGHVDAFVGTDHDRLALAFFAKHKSYPSPIQNGMDEVDFVGAHMNATSPGLREQWIEAASELRCLGGGEEDMNIFGWQHVFVEKPERMAGKLRTWIESGNLLPLSI